MNRFLPGGDLESAKFPKGEPELEDFMKTSANIAKGQILITGSATPTTRSQTVPLGTPPVGEQIYDALLEGDDEAARRLHEQYPKYPIK